MSSNRSFGLVFFFVFLAISLWPIINGDQIRIWAVVVAIVFLFLGLIKSRLLSPLNKLWFKFGIKLGAIIAPIVMAFVFFLVVTPTGFIMRILGKDLLNKKYDKKKSTYWIKRDNPINTMKNQF